MSNTLLNNHPPGIRSHLEVPALLCHLQHPLKGDIQSCVSCDNSGKKWKECNNRHLQMGQGGQRGRLLHLSQEDPKQKEG